MSNRNDNAALTILGKIVDRMTVNEAEHDERLAVHYALNQLNAMNVPHLGQLSQKRNNSNLSQMANAQYAALCGHHTHSITYNRPTLASAMEWVPYLTRQEFEALKAWRDGEDVLLHLLMRE